MTENRTTVKNLMTAFFKKSIQTLKRRYLSHAWYHQTKQSKTWSLFKINLQISQLVEPKTKPNNNLPNLTMRTKECLHLSSIQLDLVSPHLVMTIATGSLRRKTPSPKASSKLRQKCNYTLLKTNSILCLLRITQHLPIALRQNHIWREKLTESKIHKALSIRSISKNNPSTRPLDMTQRSWRSRKMELTKLSSLNRRSRIQTQMEPSYMMSLKQPGILHSPKTIWLESNTKRRQWNVLVKEKIKVVLSWNIRVL